MVDALQQFSGGGVPGPTGLVTTMLLFWLVWPAACGVLGARRGKTLSGIMNGLMWGPLGLIPVLLASPRHRCPTCGKMTLRQPHETNTAQREPIPIARPSTALTASVERRTVPPPAIVPARRIATPVSAPTPSEASETREAAELFAWVNGAPALVPAETSAAGTQEHRL
ncbi:MAG: hypothetical protein ACE5F9_04330 [Phycisphaerae bacterium]